MSLVRRIARPMIGWIFVTGGIDTFRNPAPRAALAEPTIGQLRRALPVGLPSDDERVVQLNAGVQAAAGLAFATGRAPRLAAMVLAGSLGVTTVAGHAYWKVQDPAQKAAQRIQFTKNLAVLGGLLLAMVDTDGKPGVSWRAKRAARRASQRLPKVGGD
jgi:uncharacterized membrane protein YphA (DoxX/SURF4 family)